MSFKIRLKPKGRDQAVVAIDIGSDYLKMVKGMKHGERIQIDDFAYRKFAPSEMSPEHLTRQLQEMLSALSHAKKAQIHASISGGKLCIRVVRLPVMPRAEVHQAIKSQIRKYVSPDLEQVVFSFAILGETQEKGIKKQEVVFMAARKSSLEKYLEIFISANKKPQILTAACFAQWKLIQEAGLDQGTASLMLININSQETDLSIYQEGRFVFTRNISIGEKDFTDILKDQAQLSLNKPEDLALLWNLSGQRSAEQSPQADSLMKTRELLQSEANIFCKEIEMTTHHYYQTSHGMRIDKCIIFGEGAQIPGLLNFLKQKLEIPVEGLRIPEGKLEILSQRKHDFESNLSVYAQTLGTLLTGPEDVNLLSQMPHKLRPAKQLLKLAGLPKLVQIAAIALFGLGVATSAYLKGMNLYYSHKIKAHKLALESMQGHITQLMQIKRKSDILDFERHLYAQLLKERPDYPMIIAQIIQAIPSEKTVLDRLEFYREPGRKVAVDELAPVVFTITGRVQGEELAAQETTAFVQALEKSGYFENISVALQGEDLLAGAGFDRETFGRRITPETDARSLGAKELAFIIDGIIRGNNR